MKSILITGGTGFFGRSFIKALLDRKLCDRICIYSRDEYKQHQLRKLFNNDKRLRYFIGDVRDKERLTRAMRHVDVVIHAAALKRIEVGHYNPDEMTKTNVIGSMNVIEAAEANNADRVVFLSTDKAFQPVSAYGHSKALAESLFIAANSMYGPDATKFAVTRYGNVAGSTGSIIPAWREILTNGAVVPVTDPECTRFFMMPWQAVNLVLSTLQLMCDDSFDFSKPVIPRLPAFKVGDLAEAMGAEMHVTGLPSWEKMHESMDHGNSSDLAEQMSVKELEAALHEI